MKSKKYFEIIKSIEDSIKLGKLDSMLNRMQFDYGIRSKSEFSNYLVILLALMEKGDYEISNNIFLRKVINCPDKYDSFLSGFHDTFEFIKLNSVFPFVGISNTIASFITDIIDNSDNVKNFKDKIPEKYFLFLLNFEYLKKYFIEYKDKATFVNYIRLLYNCIYDIDQTSREVQLFDEASQFFRKILCDKNDVFNNYLQHFLRSGGMRYSIQDISSLQIVPEPFFEQIFGSINEFEEIVNSSNSTIKNDILEFLSIYKVKEKVFLEDLSLKKNNHKLLKKE